MAYIGKTPVLGNFIKLDAITTSSTASYTMNYAGSPYSPQSVNHMLVSLNGVIQAPTSAYTVSGSTITFSDSLTSSDTIDFIMIYGNVLDIGTPSDGTITAAKLAGGVSGLISWQSVQTSGFTAVAGRGYPCNTTSSAFTVTLPSTPNAGDTIQLLDYAGTFDTNNLTINPNSNKLEGGTSNLVLSGDREGVTLVYIDSTQGWLASSGIQEGTDALSPPTYSVEYLTVAGGGGGGHDVGAGGGAGGLLSNTFLATVGTSYTITIGAGGAGSSSSGTTGTAGSNSSISGTGLTTITSTGGGGGGSYDGVTGGNGGSGGGGGGASSTGGGGGNGTSGQGNNGGAGAGGAGAGSGGGGGGASVAGTAGSGTTAGNGGNGSSAYSAWGSATSTGQNSGGTYYYAGGGAGCNDSGTSGTAGLGGGGKHQDSTTNSNGTANTGGGAGGGGFSPNAGGTGGSGIIILRYSGSQRGTGGTVVSSGGYTYHTFTSTSSYTA
jgi:hypothetical protein